MKRKKACQRVECKIAKSKAFRSDAIIKRLEWERDEAFRVRDSYVQHSQKLRAELDMLWSNLTFKGPELQVPPHLAKLLES